MLDPKEYDPEELRTLAGAASPTADPADEDERWAKPADFLGQAEASVMAAQLGDVYYLQAAQGGAERPYLPSLRAGGPARLGLVRVSRRRRRPRPRRGGVALLPAGPVDRAGRRPDADGAVAGAVRRRQRSVGAVSPPNESVVRRPTRRAAVIGSVGGARKGYTTGPRRGGLYVSRRRDRRVRVLRVGPGRRETGVDPDGGATPRRVGGDTDGEDTHLSGDLRGRHHRLRAGVVRRAGGRRVPRPRGVHAPVGAAGGRRTDGVGAAVLRRTGGDERRSPGQHRRLRHPDDRQRRRAGEPLVGDRGVRHRERGDAVVPGVVV